jgi:outer membrane protein assembly factor BamB
LADVIHGTKVATTRCRINLNKEKNMKLKKRFALFVSMGVVLSIVILGFIGCASPTVQSMGWSGVVTTSESIYLGSAQGNLIALNLVNGNPLWEIPIEATASGSNFLGCAAGSTAVAIYGKPAIDGDLIYLAGYNGVIYTYSITTRLSKSKALDENNPKPIVGSPVVDHGKIYVASADGKAYALEATSLNKIWEFKTGDKIWSTPVISGQTLFVGSFDKKVYAIDTMTGKEKWSFATQGAIVATPVLENGKIFVASFDRKIYALDAISGQLLWQFQGGDSSETTPQKWFWANPVISDGNIYAPNMDGMVFVIKVQDGSLVATFDLGSGIPSSPVVINNKVILATEEGKIYSLQAATNLRTEIKDLKLQVRSSLTASNGIVYVHTQKNESIYALNPDSGAVLWYTPIAK